MPEVKSDATTKPQQHDTPSSPLMSIIIHHFKHTAFLICIFAVTFAFASGYELSEAFRPKTFDKISKRYWSFTKTETNVALDVSRIIQPRRQLPKRLLAGYADWNQCDEKIIQAVKNGVNLVFWFSIDLSVDPIAKRPLIQRGPNRTCVHEIQKAILQLGYSDVIHLISIGGWNAPHLDTSHSPESIFSEWKEWNNGTFDGIDWDLEGNDDLQSQWNQFSVKALDWMGKISQLAKQDGYLVSMAPMESYLDYRTSKFDMDLRHPYPEWRPEFTYHGQNTYAYILSRYGKTKIPTMPEPIDTFDFITIQFYETLAHALYNITQLKQNPVEYMASAVENLYRGWNVEFSTVSELGYPDQKVQIPQGKLVIGLANAWADNNRTLLLQPNEIRDIDVLLNQKGIPVFGYAYWTISEEDRVDVITSRPFNLAKGLNSFLKIRMS